eukprot:s3617_g4.t1
MTSWLGSEDVPDSPLVKLLGVQLGMASSDGGAGPQLSSYVNHLRSAGLDANMSQGEHVVSDAEVPVLPDLSEPMPAGGEDEEEGVVDLPIG